MPTRMASLPEAEPTILGRFSLHATSVNNMNLHGIFTHHGHHATPSSTSVPRYPRIRSNIDMTLPAFRDYKDVSTTADVRFVPLRLSVPISFPI